MSKITFTIDGLCAVFTGKLDEPEPELIVGLINVAKFGAPEGDYHHPEITIKAVGAQIKKYEGFVTKADEAFGLSHHHSFKNDIYIHPPTGTPAIQKYVLPAGMEEDNDDMLPFDRILKIDKELYPGLPLTADLQKCSARLHFKHGLAYSMRKSGLEFVYQNAPEAEAINTLTKAAMVGLEVSFPDNEYVVLHFESNAEDFVFKGGFDYQVTISNNPTHKSQDQVHHNPEDGDAGEQKIAPHFHYYYSIIEQELQPDKQLVPRVPSASETQAGDIFCVPGGFDQP